MEHEPAAKWKSRVTAACAGSSGVIVLNLSGMRLGSSVAEPTRNFITTPVDPLPNPLASTTSVPDAHLPKSTTTSKLLMQFIEE